MANPSELTVPKERQKVSVHLAGGETLSGNIFIEYHPEALTLYQKLSAFLEGANDFFPLTTDAGAPQFISKRSIRMVRAEYPEEDQSFSLMHIEEITVLFADGSKVSGMLMADIPPERKRLSDCLNLPMKYLSARTPGAVLFINKEAVQKVVYAAKA